VLNSNNYQDWQNPSSLDNPNGDVEKCIAQGDAIYDYERVPAGWNGLDEQPVVYQYGDVSVWQNNSDDGGKPHKRAS